MSYEFVLYEIEDRVAVITINRPKAMNAINPQVVDELLDAFTRVSEDEGIRCAILTGAGEKAFVAGADITAMAKMGPLAGRDFSRRGNATMLFIERLNKPVIAAVNGFALGGGCEIAMACDFIYASENAKFGQPEINLGIVPGFGGSQRLPRRVGLGWAKELCLTGAIIGAEQAREIGLVNQVFPLEELMPAAKKTAAGIAQKGMVALRANKTLINEGIDLPIERATPMEAEVFATCFASPDQQEGMNAFIEKRKPEFKGGLK